VSGDRRLRAPPDRGPRDARGGAQPLLATRRIVVYFAAAHLHAHARALLEEWATAFGDADVVLIGDIYAARERDTLGIDSAMLARRLAHPQARAVGGMEHAVAELQNLLEPGDVLLTLGAGDGHKVGETALAALERANV
jgi:UDP-N-acetylmuramate--alanine ligase